MRPTSPPDPARAALIADAVTARIAEEIRLGFDDIPRAAAKRFRRNVDAAPHLHGAASNDHLLVELWNEKPGRTQAQVLALLDSAIARQRARMGA